MKYCEKCGRSPRSVSPRSWKDGQRVGFSAGAAVGFVTGILFACLLLVWS